MNDAFKGRKGWQCNAVVGGWDNGQNSFGVASKICTRADAEALAKANNVENCNNLIFNLEKQMQTAAGTVVSPVIADADKAYADLKSKFATVADPNGASKPFWTTWQRIYNNCKSVPAGTPPSGDRLKNYCGFDAAGKPDTAAGLTGLMQVVKGCASASCTLDAKGIKFPSN